jgi:hypothetical protein
VDDDVDWGEESDVAGDRSGDADASPDPEDDPCDELDRDDEPPRSFFAQPDPL